MFTAQPKAPGSSRRQRGSLSLPRLPFPPGHTSRAGQCYAALRCQQSPAKGAAPAPSVPLMRPVSLGLVPVLVGRRGAGGASLCQALTSAALPGVGQTLFSLPPRGPVNISLLFGGRPCVSAKDTKEEPISWACSLPVNGGGCQVGAGSTASKVPFGPTALPSEVPRE